MTYFEEQERLLDKVMKEAHVPMKPNEVRYYYIDEDYDLRVRCYC